MLFQRRSARRTRGDGNARHGWKRTENAQRNIALQRGSQFRATDMADVVVAQIEFEQTFVAGESVAEGGERCRVHAADLVPFKPETERKDE